MGTPIGDYWLPVGRVTDATEPRDDGGIARAWIADPKVYLGIPIPTDGARAGGDSGVYRRPFVKNLVFC